MFRLHKLKYTYCIYDYDEERMRFCNDADFFWLTQDSKKGSVAHLAARTARQARVCWPGSRLS